MSNPDLARLFDSDQPSLTDHAAAVTVFALCYDSPIDYLFEVDRWRSVTGGAAQLRTLSETIARTIRDSGATDFLHHGTGDYLTLLPDPANADRAARQCAQGAARATELLTLSYAAHTVPARALLDGIFPAPLRVAGVPGVSPYQARINRYYGQPSPTTLPAAAHLAARRHFGQTSAYMRYLLDDQRAGRQWAPFDAGFPLAEPCAVCRRRPAEKIVQNSPLSAVCAVCDRRDRDGSDQPYTALITLQIVGFDAVLLAQRTPAAYRRVYHSLQASLDHALKDESITVLYHAHGHAIAATTPDALLTTLIRLDDRIGAALRESKLAVRLAIGAALGESIITASPRILLDQATQALSSAIRYHDTDRLGLIIVNGGGAVSSPALYTTAVLDQLQRTRQRIAGLRLPADVFAALGGHIARGTASLYYGYGRLGLDAATLRILDQIEGEWGRESAGFYQALHLALTLTRVTSPAESAHDR